MYWLVRRDVRGSLILAGLVVSHWMLDALTHRPDMPLTPAGETVVGLGLWDHVGATLLIETLLFAAGVAIYLSVTRARRAAGSIVLWSLIAFVLLVYAGNVFGPPPPSVTVVAIAGHAIWLLVLWGWWADRLRELRAFG